MIKISRDEFKKRIQKIQMELDKRKLDGMMVYGDEYRKENLRYVCNFWPIFERGACFIPKKGSPIYAGAPEGEKYVKEMCAWDDIRNIKEFACVSVPEEIDFPLAKFSSLGEILGEILNGGKKLGFIGKWDMASPLFDRVKNACGGIEIVDASDILQAMRLIKTADEIACLKEAGRIACAGYEKLIENAIPGNTELQSAGAAEGKCRQEGAEAICFMVYGSGRRADTVIGRATNKKIDDGDMIMASMAVQYEGYVATAEFPFVAGKASSGQKKFLSILLEAANTQLKYLKDGVISGDMVKAVRAVFVKHKMEQYDIYPPMHGIGLAEAESPYPDNRAAYPLQKGMCVNSDISLFGHPDGSNRIEEGFVIGTGGPESITPYIRELCLKGF